MNTSLPKSICGVTEEMWLRCNNPLRMPKVLRYCQTRKGASRKCGLIACAYILHSPAAASSPLACRIVRNVQQQYAESLPDDNFLSALRGTLLKAFPDDLIEGPLGPALNVQHGMPADSDYWRLTGFLRGVCGVAMPGRGTVNDSANICLSRARERARSQVAKELDALRKEYERQAVSPEPATPTPAPLPTPPRTGWRGILDRLFPAFPENYVKRERPVQPPQPTFPPLGLADAVLALLPETDRARFANDTWHGGQVPVRIANRIGTLAADKQAAEVGQQLSDIVRDILGNPFRATTLEREWCEANFGAALRIAQHIVATGSYGDVAILADALEDAGCADEELLRHCRAANHVPGCWVVDAVLGWK